MGFGAETCDGDDYSPGKFSEYAAEFCGIDDCECDAGCASFLEGFDAGCAAFLVGFGTGGTSLIGLMGLGVWVPSNMRCVMIACCETDGYMGLGMLGYGFMRYGILGCLVFDWKRVLFCLASAIACWIWFLTI